ncbi:MAG: uracil-DNA glycosylase [Flavobacteriales bacterium]|nr:uracil-DNA glycosylase [Flavobacteriales bacterium]MCB9447177.1 uracil-DNA glycosylase [Flavobacteriales bacterium]
MQTSLFNPTEAQPGPAPQLEPGWLQYLNQEFRKDYFLQLKNFLLEEKQKHTVYPPGAEIFNAFNLTPFDQVKAVIIGQDPYHGQGQANGLCFSVAPGIRVPPSLVNIFKEIRDDIGCPIPSNGDLRPWAEQGVLLLNATLTVRASSAGSHQNRGWETFTDEVIRTLSACKNNLVFLLWGRFAQAKSTLIDTGKHHILKAAHPSPFAAANGFFGCKHFSKTNEILRASGQKEIDWCLP